MKQVRKQNSENDKEKKHAEWQRNKCGWTVKCYRLLLCNHVSNEFAEFYDIKVLSKERLENIERIIVSARWFNQYQTTPTNAVNDDLMDPIQYAETDENVSFALKY